MLTCVLYHIALKKSYAVYSHHILLRKQLSIFSLRPMKSLTVNLSLPTLPSNWESCYLIEVTEACLAQNINRVGG